MFTFIHALSAFSLISLAAQAATSGGAVLAVAPESDELIAPNRYIVEFDTAAHLRQAGFAKRGEDQHEYFYRQLRERSVEFDVHAEYKSNGTFVGASVQVSPGSLEKLSSAEGVLNIYTVSKVNLPSPKVLDISHSPINPLSSNSSTNSSLLSRSVASGTYSTYSQLPMIQADLVHRTQNIGTGIKIAIVDTGIDYLHPSFGSCFRTEGCKIQKGYDFVGDNFNGANDRVPDDDPYSNCNFHGTAVAGLVAGLDNGFDAPGVAPGATILPYRVFGCSGSTYTDIELAAMLKAEEDGADIINFSISSSPGWSGTALGVAAANLAKKGIQCVWASGNAGLNGLFYADSDGTDPAVIAAGSVDSAGDHLAQVTFTGSDGTSLTAITSRFFPFDQFLGPRQTYITTNDICNGMPGDAPSNLGDYIVVVPRGGCTYAAKAASASKAAAIFFVNTVDGINQPANGVNNIPSGVIGKSDGKTLQDQSASGVTYTATFPQDLVFVTRSSAGRLTDFSSSGPTYDMFYTTKLTAPGYNVLAPYPDNRWVITSGTSFSSPITAGAIALSLKAQMDRGQKRNLPAIRDALFSTAANVPYGSESKGETAASVGAGLVQVFNAINAGTIVSPSMVTLNDTEFFQAKKLISITNTGTTSITYQLENQPSALVYGLDESGNKMADYPNLDHDSTLGATVRFSRRNFTIRANSTVSVVMTWTAPAGVDASRLPIYSGQILITGGPIPVKVTYMGAATKMRDLKMISTRPTQFGTTSPALLQGVYAAPASPGQSFGFADNDKSGFPSVMFNLLTGTRSMVMDLVAADADLGFQPTYSKRDIEGVEGSLEIPFGDTNGTGDIDVEAISGEPTIMIRGKHVIRTRSNLGSVHSFGNLRRSAHRSGLARRELRKITAPTTVKEAEAPPAAKANTYVQVPVQGNIFSWMDVSRNNNNIDTASTNSYTYVRLVKPLFGDGSRIPNGSYKFLLRVLKVNGDPTQQSDYDTWVSPEFSINA